MRRKSNRVSEGSRHGGGSRRTLDEGRVLEEIGDGEGTGRFHHVDRLEGDPERCELRRRRKKVLRNARGRVQSRGNGTNRHVESDWRTREREVSTLSSKGRVELGTH